MVKALPTEYLLITRGKGKSHGRMANAPSPRDWILTAGNCVNRDHLLPRARRRLRTTLGVVLRKPHISSLIMRKYQTNQAEGHSTKSPALHLQESWGFRCKESLTIPLIVKETEGPWHCLCDSEAGPGGPWMSSPGCPGAAGLGRCQLSGLEIRTGCIEEYPYL